MGGITIVLFASTLTPLDTMGDRQHVVAGVSPVRIMGIDPSLTGTGLALIEDGVLKDSRVISTVSGVWVGERLAFIGRYVLGRYADWRPDCIAMEDYAYGSPFSRETLGEVGGTIKYVLWQSHGVVPMLWPVRSWRKVVLKDANLKKEDVKVEAFRRFGWEMKDNNEIEAACIAIAEHLAQLDPKVRPVHKIKRGKKS